MADTSMIGKSLSPVRYTVERGKIREFVLAIGETNPVYTDAAAAQAAGYADVIAPPTLPTVFDTWGGFDFPGLCSALGINPLRLLHGEQEYEYRAPVHPGDVITGVPKLVDVAHRQGSSGPLTLITLETQYTNQRGEVVVVGRSTLVERG